MPLRIARDDCVIGVVQQWSQVGELLPRPTLFGDVACHQHRARDGTPVVVEGAAVAAEAPAPAVRCPSEELFADDHLPGPGRPQNRPLRRVIPPTVRTEDLERLAEFRHAHRRGRKLLLTVREEDPPGAIHERRGVMQALQKRLQACVTEFVCRQEGSLPVHSGTWSIRACSPVVNALRKATASSGKLANS